jgi:hypothetical protein
VNLATHLSLVPMLRMSGAIPLLPSWAFMACTVTSPLPFPRNGTSSYRTATLRGRAKMNYLQAKYRIKGIIVCILYKEWDIRTGVALSRAEPDIDFIPCPKS